MAAHSHLEFDYHRIYKDLAQIDTQFSSPGKFTPAGDGTTVSLSISFVYECLQASR